MNKFVQDRVNPPAPRTIVTDTKEQITCLATNKDFNLVACAGRQVFKVFAIDEERFTEKINLRSAQQRPNLNYVAVDVVWSPRDENIIASASSNGSVVLWDLNKTGKNKQEHVHSLHERAASRLCFHSQEALLLSGGKDRVCKLFDTRQKKVVSCFQSVAVHDVQWWPNQYFMFASATDNGSIQIWDYRHPNTCLVEFPAHSGPVFALDFHPDDKYLLASGGRDKLIKVWKLPEAPSPQTVGQHTVTQPYQIQTIAPVSRVKWRPKRHTQIASVVNSFDLGVNVWELRRPFIPLATFTEHKDVVTSIIWKDSHEFLSGGKDSRLVLHSFRDAVRICDKVNPIAISSNRGDQLVLAVNEKLQSSSSTLAAGSRSSSVGGPTSQSSSNNMSSGAKPFQNLFSRSSSTKPDKRELFIKDTKSGVFFFEPPAEDFDSKWFEFCAKNYVLYGRSFEDMCQHNSDIAAQHNQIQIMKHWLLLKILFGSCFETPSFLVTNLSHSLKIADTPITARPEVNGTNGDLNHNHHIENGDLTSGVSCDEDSDEHYQAHTMDQTTTHDFLYEDNELDGFEFELDDKDEIQYEDEQEFILPPESFMPSHDLSEAVDPHNSHTYHSSSHAQPLYHEGPLHRDKYSEQRSPEKVSVIQQALDVPIWDSISSVVALLHSYADFGDVQTAVSMYTVLSNKIKQQITVDDETLEGWMTAYIDLLEMFKLWCEANTIITKCNVKSVQQMNQASTAVHTACASCQKSLYGTDGWYCKKCDKITSICSICHTPVKGIYVWCQGCAHGGHIEHMRDWFISNTKCPTGCGHECELT